MKLTLSPSGGVPPLEFSVAVKVTASPKVDGLLEDVSVVVTAAFTTSTKVFEVLPVNVVSPR